jgi:uncharacterized protein
MKIRLGNLDEGVSEIHHEHNRDSLELNELEDINAQFDEPVHVKAEINKVGHQFFLKIDFSSMVTFDCDRCLVPFDRKLSDSFRLVYTAEKLDMQDDSDVDGDIRLLKAETGEVDITKDIREALLLLIPIKKICSDECRGICPVCGANLNEKECHHDAEQTDPRWDALKKLIK